MHTHGFEWKDEHVAEIKKLIIAGNTAYQISEILSKKYDYKITQPAVQKMKERFGLRNHLLYKDNEIKVYKTQRLPMDNYMLTCDEHSPYYSEEYVNRVLFIAKKFGIKKHVDVGDLFDMDFIKFWMEDQQDRTDLDWEAQRSDPLMKAYAYFDMNYLIMGNHERRVGMSTEGKIQAKHLMSIFGKDLWPEKLKFIPYSRLEIGSKYILTHPRSYSQISASVSVRLAEKYHRHNINAHGHFVALRYDRSGRYMGIDLGGMFDKKKIKYLAATTTTHPEWNNGFGMIYNGKFYLFHDETDWDWWLK